MVEANFPNSVFAIEYRGFDRGQGDESSVGGTRISKVDPGELFARWKKTAVSPIAFFHFVRSIDSNGGGGRRNVLLFHWISSNFEFFFWLNSILLSLK